LESPEETLARITQGLRDRLRTLLLALDRRDRLETAQTFVGWLERERAEGNLATDAREMLLRALRVASEPLNYQILSHLDPLESIDLEELMEVTALGRVAASERVNDMVQTGLVVRELVDDQIRGTELAQGLTLLIERIAAEAGKRLAEELATTQDQKA
jgi:hypothetical protein